MLTIKDLGFATFADPFEFRFDGYKDFPYIFSETKNKAVHYNVEIKMPTGIFYGEIEHPQGGH